MAKNIDPQCKQCRREKEKLFMKGERCFSQKCAIVKRNYPPGQFGPANEGSRGRLSEFGIQLREKQKAKKLYNVLEKQLRNYYIEANKKKGATGDTLIRLLESRLDNVVYRLSFAKSRRKARQMVSHGHIFVNNKKVSIPSYRVKVGDIIMVSEVARKQKGFANLGKEIIKEEIPQWFEFDMKGLSGNVVREPTIDDIGIKINSSLIVEYYSR